MKLVGTLVVILLAANLNAQTIPERVQQGITMFNAGNLEGAAQVLNQVIQENPQHGPARFVLGQIAMERSLWKEAEEHLKIAVVSSPRRPHVVWQLYGKLQLLLHNYTEARRAFEQSLQQSPDFLPAFMGRGQSALFLNDTAAAMTDLKRASAESAEAVLLLAETLIYLNRDEEARSHLTEFRFSDDGVHRSASRLLLDSIRKDAASGQELRKSVSENLGQPESYLALGISEVRKNNKQAAVSLFHIAFQLNDQNPVAVLFLKKIDPGKEVGRFKEPHAEIVKKISAAQDALNQQKPDQARVIAEQILAQRPKHIQARLMLIEAGEKEKKYWEALAHYKEIPEPVHGFPAIQARFALLAQKMGAHELAECHIRKALGAEGENGYLHYVLATILKSREKLDAALAAAKRSIELGFQEPSAYLALGDIYYERMEISQSIAALGKAVEMDPRSADTIASFALSALTTDDHAVLRSLLEKHAKANPQNIETLYSLAIIHSNENNLNRAKEYFSMLEKLAPDQSEIYYNLALVNLRLGLESEGSKAMARFQELKEKERIEWLKHNGAHKIRIEARDAVENRSTNEAIRLYTQLTSGNLAQPADWIGLANAYVAAGKHNEAFKSFEKALQHSPYNQEALSGAARTAKTIGNNSSADLYSARFKMLTEPCV